MKLNASAISIKTFLITASISATTVASDNIFPNHQNIYNGSEVNLIKYDNGGV